MVSLGHRGPAPGGHRLQAGKAGHQDLAEGVSTLLFLYRAAWRRPGCGRGPEGRARGGSNFMSWRLRLSHGQGPPGTHRLVPKEILGRSSRTNTCRWTAWGAG